jgi:hypothetical protein
MSNSSTLICPVSNEKVNESVVRITAGIICMVSIIGLLIGNEYVFAFLAVDFSLRAFTNGNYSLLKYLAIQLQAVVGFKQQLIDAAPKKFAAGLGIWFCAIIAVLLHTQFFIAASILASIIIALSFLEAAFAVCVGCWVYSFLVLPLKRKLSS